MDVDGLSLTASGSLRWLLETSELVIRPFALSCTKAEWALTLTALTLVRILTFIARLRDGGGSSTALALKNPFFKSWSNFRNFLDLPSDVEKSADVVVTADLIHLDCLGEVVNPYMGILKLYIDR